MAEKSVDGEQLLQSIETYHGRITELTRHVRLHQHLLPAVNQGLQGLIELNEARPRLEGEELLRAYRKIKGLIFIGPAEWEKALLGPEGENPLELESGWCHKLVSDQGVVSQPVEVIKGVVEYCRTPDWKTTPILWLRGPKIISPKCGEISMDILGQNRIWGVSHDGIAGGLVRQDVFWSNYFVGANHTAKPECPWAHEPPCDTWEYGVGYELPHFTTLKNWKAQKQAVQTREGLQLVSAPRDTLMLNLVLAATGRRLRSASYSRTTTIHDGYPLNVDSDGYGVCVRRGWYPGDADGSTAASVQGVLEL